MHFTIGTRQYLVKRRWKLTCDGETADGLCDFTSRTIWLDADLRPDVIVGVLRHEHVHAWEAEVGRTQSDEDRANFISTVSEAFEYEFDAQGGLAALTELPISGNRGAAPKAQPVRPMGECRIGSSAPTVARRSCLGRCSPASRESSSRLP
jgi:hypothetical protein